MAVTEASLRESDTKTGKPMERLSSLLPFVALSKVVPQRLHLPAALLRGFRKTEVLHSFGNVCVNVAVVDETPQGLLEIFFTPDIDKYQGLLVCPRAGCWLFS